MRGAWARFFCDTPARRVHAGGVIALALLFGSATSETASAQRAPDERNPVDVESSNIHLSGNAALLDIGSRFLQRLGALSLYRSAGTGGSPRGGGADLTTPAESPATAPPETTRYRAWFEAYGLVSHTEPQGDFVGDRRKTYGGIAGIGASLAPGVMVGLSVDQGRTDIDIMGVPQTGRVDLTQIGFNASVERGSWGFGAALIYGFGGVHSSRIDSSGEATAAYGATLWGALGEFSYVFSLPNNSRFVPRFGADWTQTRTAAFLETGNATPISGTSVTATRTRVFAGAELGHSWIADRAVWDAAVYGRFVDNVVQDLGDLQINFATGLGTPVLVAGVRESNLGADAGAVISAKVSQLARLYAVYDGRFRSNYTSHTGTIGAELRW